MKWSLTLYGTESKVIGDDKESKGSAADGKMIPQVKHVKEATGLVDEDEEEEANNVDEVSREDPLKNSSYFGRVATLNRATSRLNCDFLHKLVPMIGLIWTLP